MHLRITRTLHGYDTIFADVNPTRITVSPDLSSTVYFNVINKNVFTKGVAELYKIDGANITLEKSRSYSVGTTSLKFTGISDGHKFKVKFITTSTSGGDSLTWSPISAESHAPTSPVFDDFFTDASNDGSLDSYQSITDTDKLITRARIVVKAGNTVSHTGSWVTKLPTGAKYSSGINTLISHDSGRYHIENRFNGIGRSTSGTWHVELEYVRLGKTYKLNSNEHPYAIQDFNKLDPPEYVYSPTTSSHIMIHNPNNVAVKVNITHYDGKIDAGHDTTYIPANSDREIRRMAHPYNFNVTLHFSANAHYDSDSKTFAEKREPAVPTIDSEYNIAALTEHLTLFQNITDVDGLITQTRLVMRDSDKRVHSSGWVSALDDGEVSVVGTRVTTLNITGKFHITHLFTGVKRGTSGAWWVEINYVRLGVAHTINSKEYPYVMPDYPTLMAPQRVSKPSSDLSVLEIYNPNDTPVHININSFSGKTLPGHDHLTVPAKSSGVYRKLDHPYNYSIDMFFSATNYYNSPSFSLFERREDTAPTFGDAFTTTSVTDGGTLEVYQSISDPDGIITRYRTRMSHGWFNMASIWHPASDMGTGSEHKCGIWNVRRCDSHDAGEHNVQAIKTGLGVDISGTWSVEIEFNRLGSLHTISSPVQAYDIPNYPQLAAPQYRSHHDADHIEVYNPNDVTVTVHITHFDGHIDSGHDAHTIPPRQQREIRRLGHPYSYFIQVHFSAKGYLDSPTMSRRQ